ncbi:MAG: archaellin/type IV pilin N-terminal domain-containing protein [Candidatus Bathyarchaeales archaeon]
MKILKSKKALSPVVASIILIAVTVAVSIAVAAWMGALTFTFMTTEQIDIRHISWTPSTDFTLTVYNTGTSPVTITQVLVNNVDKTSVSNIPTNGLTVPEGDSRQINVNYNYVNGTSYEIVLITSKGNRFSKTFVGGTPA